MNTQVNLIIPIPIMEEIISLCGLFDKMTFRVTCKQFLLFTTIHFFPTFTTALCGSECGYQDGEFTRAAFNHPTFGVLDSFFNNFYISDSNNHVIRRIDLLTNQVTTLCGTPTKVGWKDGIGNEAQFWFPRGLALHKKENLLYISDSWNHVIRSVNLNDGSVTTIVGNSGIHGKEDGIGKDATLNYPCGLILDSISNSLYVADSANHSIRRILLKEKRMETLCGNGQAGHKDGTFEEAQFNYPWDIALHLETQELFVSDWHTHVIRVLSLKNKTVNTLCGIPKVSGCENGNRFQAKFYYPSALKLDRDLHCLYVTDFNHIVREISLSGDMKIVTLCGTTGITGKVDGFLSAFSFPEGIVVDSRSHILYILDTKNHKIRKMYNKKRALSQNEISSPPKKRVF